MNVNKNELLKLVNIKDKKIFKTENKYYNHLIKGDELHVMRILQLEGAGMVDVIYINPMYEIDNITENWLDFLKDRLLEAKKLLEESGVILISIDDNRYVDIRLLCNEIFNKNNYIDTLIYKTDKYKNKSDLLYHETEYVLCYAKDKEQCRINKKIKDSLSNYNIEDNYFHIRGKYRLVPLDKASLRYLESRDFTIEIDGKIFIPGGTIQENSKHIWNWTCSKEQINYAIEDKYLVVAKDRHGIDRVYRKCYQYCDNQTSYIEKVKSYSNIIDNIKTNTEFAELNRIFGKNNKIFEYSTPVGLVKHLLKIFSKPGYLILDFFAGTGSTGHAVMDLNKEDGGKRLFILINNNKNDIFENITYPRLQMAIEGVPDTVQPLWSGYNENLIVEELSSENN